MVAFSGLLLSKVSRATPQSAMLVPVWVAAGVDFSKL
jgi:hypothetical protein